MRLRPRLVAIDLDGTLVEPRAPIRPAVVAAVGRARAAGLVVTIITGRMFVGAKPFVEILDLDGPIACYQGAVIADARTGRFAAETPLEYALAVEVYGVAKAAGFHVQFYRDDRFYVEANNAFAQLYARTSGVQPTIVASLPDAFAGHGSTKVNVVTDPARAPAAFELLYDRFGERAYVTRSNPEFVEVLNARVDKGEALATIARHYSIDLANVVGIGDSYNDQPFLERAGFAIAMGSAPEELRTIADAVVSDVAHDGVAEAIDRYVLGSLIERSAAG